MHRKPNHQIIVRLKEEKITVGAKCFSFHFDEDGGEKKFEEAAQKGLAEAERFVRLSPGAYRTHVLKHQVPAIALWCRENLCTRVQFKFEAASQTRASCESGNKGQRR